jgi:hypothetical protein
LAAFEEVSRAIGLRQRFTQRGLRRTFNDLAREAQVEGVVTKSISGHLTERMRERYSTVAPIEQRASIARVIDKGRLIRPKTLQGSRARLIVAIENGRRPAG